MADEVAAAGKPKYGASAWPKPKARAKAPSAGGGVLMIRDKITVQVAQGDITEEDTDAIVNSTDSKLGMDSQVSKAILRKGGSEVLRECKRVGKTDKNGIAVTSAGDLKCKSIIHVETPTKLDFKYSIGSIGQQWAQRIEAMLKKAVELRCTSISIPALGTGQLNLGADNIADYIINSIIEFCKKNKEKSLTLVRIVVFQQEMVSTFQSKLESNARKGKGFLKMAKDYWYGVDDEMDMTYESIDHHKPLHVSKMTFTIYAKDQKSVNEVTKKIEMTCNSESKVQILETKKDQEAIKNLNEEQIEVIKGLEKKHDVKIEIQKMGRINKIKVEGRHEDTFDAIADINRLLRDIEDSAKFEEHAKVLHKQVQWEVDEGNGFEPFEASISAKIEKAYIDGLTFAEFREELVDTHELRTTKVTFSPMEQIINDDHRNKCPVRRKTPETMTLPKDWEKMKKDEIYKVVQLPAGSPEYTQVETTFKNSLTAGGSSCSSILQISRIQNPSMYQKYVVHRKHMEAANPPTTTNERELWHGTAADALDEIHATGFNRNFCGRNGTAYGKGVYFATFASLSNGYATPDANGHRHMYLSKVLTGQFTRGNSAFLVPPQRDPNNKEIKFDSVVDNETNTKIYVIFFDTQAYPEYLIKYC